MSAVLEPKDARVEFKTSKKIKSLLQEAANSLGMDLSSFLVMVATQKAKDVIIEDKMLKLSKSEWGDFEKVLDTPQVPTKVLRDLMAMEDFDEV